MKLILSSAGLETDEIISKCEELTGKKRSSINVAIINEGYAVEHESNLWWVLYELDKVRDTFGGNLELVNLLALDIKTIKERIELCDMIYVVGGHTDYIMSVFNKTGFSKLLPELLKTKVYMGSSGGSMIIGKRFSDEANEILYGEHNDYKIDHFLDLVDMTILPHLDSKHFPVRKEEIVKSKIARNYNQPIYGLRDDNAIVVNGDSVTVIGREPLILNMK
jgi:peptidase E